MTDAFFALLAVLALLFGAAFILRRLKVFPTMPSKGLLKVEDSLFLDAQRRLMLVSCEEKKILILLSPRGEKILSEELC